VRHYILLFIGSILLAVFFARVDCSQLLFNLRSFPLSYALLIISINAANGFIKTVRWRYFLRIFGINSDLLKDYLSVNSAFFLGLVTPGTAGELSRIMSVGGERKKGVSIILFEKVTDFGLLTLFVIVSVLLQVTEGKKLYIGLFCLIMSVAMLYFIFIRFQAAIAIPVRGILSRIANREKIKNVRDGYVDFYSLLSNPLFLFFSCVTSLLLWVLPLLQVYLIYHGMGMTPSIKFVALTYFIPYFIGVISFIPLGIGTFEFSLREIAVHGGDFMLSEIVSMIPLFYRMFVTVPLIVFGYACQVVLTMIERKQRAVESVRG
jgi:uncharacterized protein (TIRG00374 family)